MNATVTRIVDILFQDAEMNEENQALHDELLRNCQDRYDDLIAQGKSEDEAIAVVVDSLKGMEDVIGTRSSARRAAPSGMGGGDDEWRTQTFPAQSVRVICMDLRDQDVRLENAEGRDVTVSYVPNECPELDVRLDGDRLVVNLSGSGRTRSTGASGWQWLTDIFSHIGQSGDVVVGVPSSSSLDLEIHTLSGDVDLTEGAFREAAVSTTSGDLDISGGAFSGRVKLQTASGDMHLTLDAPEVTLRSMSGDVDYKGACGRLDASSVSGDLELRGRIPEAALKTVSGDARLIAEDEGVRRVSAASTSGDVIIRLPTQVASVHLSASSVSGDVRSRFADNGPASQVQVEARTVSGDVSVK